MKEIEELFVTFIKCERGTTGVNVAALRLNFNHCIGQGCDGAGNVAGTTTAAASITSVGLWPRTNSKFSHACRRLFLVTEILLELC